MDWEREALLIIPEEMWEHIFSYFNPLSGIKYRMPETKRVSEIATSDLLNCSRVCKDFARILGKEKTTWLFREV